MLKQRGKIIKRLLLFWEWAKQKGEFKIKEATQKYGKTVKILILEMCKQGFLRRTGWGRYEVIEKEQ